MKLENLTFRGGVHMKDYKELSSGSEITTMPAPKRVTIAMSQHTGAPAKVIVAKGDHVKVGQLIGEAGGYVSANVHASISGEVVEITEVLMSTGVKTQAVVIENDGLNELGYEKQNRGTDVSPEEIIKYITEAGIVGLGGAGFPTHVKLSPPADKPIDAVIVNAAECEPYLTADDITMRTVPEKIIQGLRFAMSAVHAERGFIAIENNKPKAIESLEKALGDDPKVKIAVMKTRYPQGDEKQLIFAVLGKQVPAGGLPMDVGAVVCNAGSLVAVTDAVMYGKPLYERVLTVTGHAVAQPRNLLVPFGTSIKDLVEFCGGYTDTPKRIIFGGPMMGVAQHTDAACTEKRTNGVLLLTDKQISQVETTECIRCSRCVEVCPMQLEPLYIATAAEFENYDVALAYHINTCMECGCCSYICPSKRPLTELIRFGKREIRAKSR